MKKLAFCLTAPAFCFNLAFSSPAVRSAGQVGVFQDFFSATLAEGEAAFVFLGYSAVLVRTVQGTVIIDPAGLVVKDDMSLFQGKKVNAVLYTHAHGDHFNSDTAVALSQTTGAPVCAEGSIIQTLKKGGALPAEKIVELSAGRPQILGGIEIVPVRGSHIGPILLFHIKAGGISLFHGGDSAYVPLNNLTAGLAFLPAGAPSPTASPDAATRMARDLKPRVVVAIHGSDAQYQDLTKKVKAALPGTEVIIPETLKLYKVKVI